MKLLRATFENFRLLRNLELEFASESNQNLTVIRAANESGKTTVLHALQWALYGDIALPEKGKNFRLYPIDWDTSAGTQVSVVVTIEFETVSHRLDAEGKTLESRRRFRLVRSALEEVDSKSARSGSTIKLFILNEDGDDPVDAPETLVKEELPPELREVFFTDGDRALSFIEAGTSPLKAKRDRVEQAINSLLGLGVIEDAMKHVRKTIAEVNTEAGQIVDGSELQEVTSRLAKIEASQNELQNTRKDAEQQLAEFKNAIHDVERNIEEALQKGDKEELRNELNRAKQEIKRLDGEQNTASKNHSDLFRSNLLATDLLAPLLDRAFNKLDELHDAGKVPNTTIPLLQDRLLEKSCICGETLEPSDPAGKARREHIQSLIDDSQRADRTRETLSELYYSSRNPNLSVESSRGGMWLAEYTTILKHRDDVQHRFNEVSRRSRGLEKKLDELPNTDIQSLRQSLTHLQAQYEKQMRTQTICATKLEELDRESKGLESKRDRLLRGQQKGALIRAKLQVTQDIREVLQKTREQIINTELAKVSDLMCSFFLEMIGADSNDGAIIQRAEISKEFDILVYGLHGRMLNPDRDLNGASRRALTLAFILALTKVSEVEAPNVIDTPLGMTSGFVKQSILKTVLRESAQLVLFLTPSEIIGCEEIIDKAAGKVFTLTNSGHYPKMLVNNPDVVERMALRCACNHRIHCQLCQRRIGVETEPKVALLGDN